MKDFAIVFRKDPKVGIKINDILGRYNFLPPEY